MNLKNTLLTIPEREDGGRTAYDRLDYQTAWGVSRLLELHSKKENYAIAFEFHDDIVVFNDAENPTKVIFYQVKTQISGNWTLAKITKRPTGKTGLKSSFAGKMLDNAIKFGASVEKLSFVSNQPLSDVIVIHGEAPISGACSEKIKKFVSDLQSEEPSFKDPEQTNLFFFRFSDLNLTNYEETILGKITIFLEEELGIHITPRPFALSINNYCRKRSKSLANLSSYDELKTSKCITKTDIDALLLQIKEQNEHRPDWTTVSTEIQNDLTFPEKIKIERAWKNYEIKIRSRPNAATIAFVQQMRLLIDDLLETAENLVDLMNKAYPQSEILVKLWEPDADIFFIKAAILYECKR